MLFAGALVAMAVAAANAVVLLQVDAHILGFKSDDAVIGNKTTYEKLLPTLTTVGAVYEPSLQRTPTGDDQIPYETQRSLSQSNKQILLQRMKTVKVWDAHHVIMWLLCGSAALLLLTSLHEAMFATSEHDLPRSPCSTLPSETLGFKFIFLLTQVAINVDMTALVPVSYDFTTSLGGGAGESGLLLSVALAAQPIGTVMSWCLWKHLDQRCLRFATLLFVLLTGGFSWCNAWSLQHGGTQGMDAFWRVVALRICTGVCQAGSDMLLNLIVVRTCSAGGLTQLCILRNAALNLGICCGPILGSQMILQSSGKSGGSAREATVHTMQALSVMWLILLGTLLLFMPSNWRTTMVEDEMRSREQSISKSSRESLVLCALCFTAERAFTMSAVEVATALILETVYAQPTGLIGFVIGKVFAASAMFGLLMAAVKHLILPDALLMALLAAVALIGAVLMLDFGRNGSHSPAWLLLLADGIVYSSSFNLSGFVDAIAMRSTMESTWYSLSNFQLIRLLVSCASRTIAPPLVRTILERFGRNAYASMIAIVVSLGCASIYHVLRLLFMQQTQEPSSSTANGQPHQTTSQETENDESTLKPPVVALVGLPRTGSSMLGHVLTLLGMETHLCPEDEAFSLEHFATSFTNEYFYEDMKFLYHGLTGADIRQHCLNGKAIKLRDSAWLRMSEPTRSEIVAIFHTREAQAVERSIRNAYAAHPALADLILKFPSYRKYPDRARHDLNTWPLEKTIQRIHDFNVSSLPPAKDSLFVDFDDLTTSPRKTVQQIKDFLQKNIPGRAFDEDSIERAVQSIKVRPAKVVG